MVAMMYLFSTYFHVYYYVPVAENTKLKETLYIQVSEGNRQINN